MSGDHAATPSLITVASHTRRGDHAEHSNWGVNVDVHAPGCAISTVHTDGATVTETGSSVATAIGVLVKDGYEESGPPLAGVADIVVRSIRLLAVTP